jgi:hypothetical protein
MTEPSRKNLELMDLLNAVWDSGMNEPIRGRIEELVSRDSQTALELLISYSRLHLDLKWVISSDAAHEKALRSLRIVTPNVRSVRWWRHWRSAGLIGITAASVIMVLSNWFKGPPGLEGLIRTPQPVGRVVRLENADWTGGAGPQSNDALTEGQTVDIRSGIAQLSMGFGADVLLQGPCRARILASDRVALERGKLGVRAAKWAIGFKVETEDLVATDLGTWFSVQSGGGTPAEIHVLEGTVLADSVNVNETTRRLGAAEAVGMTREGTIQPIKFRREATAEQLTEFAPLRPIKIWNTGIGLREGDQDPHWTVIAGDEREGPYPRPAVVGVPHVSYGINEAERSQWISVDRGTTEGVPARSKYTFETTFDLTGFDLNSVWASGLVLADDGVDEVWLNGKQLNIPRWSDWTYGINYVKFRPVEIRSGFVPGVNRLAFVVKNESFIIPSDQGFDVPDTPNPMALRAEWQAFGRPLKSRGRD